MISRSTPRTRPRNICGWSRPQGLKIQLRSPMKPVAKLAFDGMCDDRPSSSSKPCSPGRSMRNCRAARSPSASKPAAESRRSSAVRRRRLSATPPLRSRRGPTRLRPERVRAFPSLRQRALALPSPRSRGEGLLEWRVSPSRSPSTTASTAHLRDSSVRVWRSPVSWTDRRSVRLAIERSSAIAVSGSCCSSRSNSSSTASASGVANSTPANSWQLHTTRQYWVSRPAMRARSQLSVVAPDTASMRQPVGRNVDDPRAGAASPGLADRGGQPQRAARRAAPLGLVVGSLSEPAHASSPSPLDALLRVNDGSQGRAIGPLRRVTDRCRPWR